MGKPVSNLPWGTEGQILHILGTNCFRVSCFPVAGKIVCQYPKKAKRAWFELTKELLKYAMFQTLDGLRLK